MKLRKIGYIVPMILCIFASPLYSLLKSSGIDSTAGLMIEAGLVGMGIGWLCWFGLTAKYLPQ